MDKYDKIDVTGRDGELLTVLKHQSQRQEALLERTSDASHGMDGAISATEDLLRALGRPLPAEPTGPPKPPVARLSIRSWSEILAEAEASVVAPVGLTDLLSPEDVYQIESRIGVLRGEFDAAHRLDAIDWAIAGVAGTVAALTDAFLVKMPSAPGFLGSSPTKGGQLSDFIRGRLRKAFSPEQIRELERGFPVPYDASISRGLSIKIEGLGPRTHRFQSLGHDPILGFLIGTADILWGTMTAVDSSGVLIRQSTQPGQIGKSLFDALAKQAGHLASDVGTRAGLPAPLMPLLQFLQMGAIGDKERTIGELSRLMYVKGYDFGHFLAMSVTPLLIEVIVRACYAVKRMIEGHSLMESIPMRLPGGTSPPKLQTMLFTAHLIATSANAGRVCLGPAFNPLALNYPQWVAFGKYSLEQLRWVLWEKENRRLNHVQKQLDADWEDLDRRFNEWWLESASTSPPIVLD
jgi:hypothetical protein